VAQSNGPNAGPSRRRKAPGSPRDRQLPIESGERHPQTSIRQHRRGERGSILFVVLFLATAIAALATLSSSRVVAEVRTQEVLEDETQAFSEAFAQLQVALNVVNTSAYNEKNQNLALLDAVSGDFGGTAGGEAPTEEGWLDDPEGIAHGKVDGTDVRVYRGREYIERLAKLKGEMASDVDPEGVSDSYYVLEAAGRAGDTVRVVSALVRENEPFSSFVFFQNRHVLGISGAPRGLIHANDRIAFYFPNGSHVDSVGDVHQAGPGRHRVRGLRLQARRHEVRLQPALQPAPELRPGAAAGGHVGCAGLLHARVGDSPPSPCAQVVDVAVAWAGPTAAPLPQASARCRAAWSSSSPGSAMPARTAATARTSQPSSGTASVVASSR